MKRRIQSTTTTAVVLMSLMTILSNFQQHQGVVAFSPAKLSRVQLHRNLIRYKKRALDMNGRGNRNRRKFKTTTATATLTLYSTFVEEEEKIASSSSSSTESIRDDVVKVTDKDEHTSNNVEQHDEDNWLVHNIKEKIGTVEDSRMAVPEFASGEVPRIFSNISYKQKDVDGSGNMMTQALHESGSTVGAAALVAGSTIGAGILALPTATAPAGFLPSSGALILAWAYMTLSGLLIAELAINRMGETGRQGIGLLELYSSSLGKNLGYVCGASYFFLHYAVLVAYMSKGGSNLGLAMDALGLDGISSIYGLDQALFAASLGGFVYFARPSTVEKVNNGLVLAVIATFVGVIGVGARSADFDFSALIALQNQHPEMVVNALPICFLSVVFHNVVPTVVTQLEGDRSKITKALFAGTFVPLLMFLGWNGVILGNVVNVPGALNNGVDPITVLQNSGVGGEILGPLVTVFSELAIMTSIIGFIYGLLDAWTDVFKLPLKGPEFEKYKAPLFAAVLVPPLMFSLGNANIFFDALDYGGAFGVSTLFLVLPSIMVWNERYSDNEKMLTSPPMVPLGKLSLASMWKAAATLILEQGADKLGLFDFVKEIFSQVD